MIMFFPALHVIAKALLNTNRGPFNCHLSINMSEFFGRFCVFCVTLSERIHAPGHRSFFFFFPPLLPNPKKSLGVAFPDSNVNNKKSEEREKKG